MLDHRRLRNAIVQMLEDSFVDKKKFVETVELQISLRYDPCRDKRFRGSVVLPHPTRSRFRVMVISDSEHYNEASRLGFTALSTDDLRAWKKNKKIIKKIMNLHDIIMASDNIIRQIPRLMGPSISKIGKFPKVLGEEDTVQDKIDELKRTVTFQMRKYPALAVAVGTVALNEDEVHENIHKAVNFLIELLPEGWKNVKKIGIKSSMAADEKYFPGEVFVMPAPSHVVVHPLVLLSVVDHFNRLTKGSRKRVVGVLLGEQDAQGRVDVTNSYAVPFAEDERTGIWFLDHNYHENMFHMFKKVNARERVVGWYSTGPKIKSNDLAIHEVFRDYTQSKHPVYVIVEVQPKELGIPTKAYVTVEEISEDKTENRMAFQHTSSSIGALEAEEVGVEHLLRDVKDASVSDLTTSVQEKVSSLKSLNVHVKEMEDYLSNVCSGKLPPNHQIINQIQDIFNLLPNLNVEELVRSFSIKTNDMMLVIYLSSVIRSVIALHNLVNNKIANRDAEVKLEEN